MNFGSLFAGVGGFDAAFEQSGMECAWQVEIDSQCNKVLEKYWPKVARYGDIRECHADEGGNMGLAAVDVICGGFP